MSLFLYSLAVFVLFVCILSVLAIKSRHFLLFGMNLIGLFSAAYTFAQEIIEAQTKLSLVVSLSMICLVIIYDFAHLIYQVILDRKNRFDNPKLWAEFMKNRTYKMIFWEEKFKKDLERLKDIKMSENLQALQAWKEGNQAFLQGNFEQALEKYELSLNWRQTCVAQINKSGVIFERNDYDQVIVVCEEAIKLNPDVEEAWLNKGLAHEALDELENAAKSFEEALVVNPDNTESLLFLGNIQKKQGDFEPAVANYQKAIEHSPGNFEAFFKRGVAFTFLNRLNEAQESFNQALSIKPKHEKANYHLANTLNKLDNNKEAVSAYQKVLKMNPKFPEAWNNLGIAYSKLGQLKDSVKAYSKAIEFKPEYHEAWLNKGLASETLKKYEDASFAYTRFLELAPDTLAKHRSIAQKHLDDIKKLVEEKSRKKPTMETNDEKNQSKE